ncbi:MAG: fumarylacetoacetate hydrolase family protein, partial [Hyphomicrobiaceae bacterium]
VRGWKVGAKSPSDVPVCAPLVAGSIVGASKDAIAVGSEPIGIELEIAFRISRDFPVGAAEPSPAEILDAVGSAHIVVELCRSRLAEGTNAPPLWLLADRQMNHMLVLGSEIRGWRDAAFDRMSARLSVDGALVHDAVGGYAPETPLPLLIWLVRHAVRSRGGLPAGSVVTTGSWTGLRWIKPPILVQGVFAPGAEIDVALV